MAINQGPINGFPLNSEAGIPQYSMPISLDTSGASVSMTIPTLSIKGDAVSRRFFAEFNNTALPALAVVIKSINGTLNDDGTSRLQIVIPLSDGVESSIAPYLTGTFTLEFQDVYQDSSTESTFSEVFTVDSVRQDNGTSSASLTIGGSYTVVNSTPLIIPIKGLSYTALQADGNTRLRCDLDREFKNGSIARYSGGDLTADQVTYIITPNNQYMELVG